MKKSDKTHVEGKTPITGSLWPTTLATATGVVKFPFLLLLYSVLTVPDFVFPLSRSFLHYSGAFFFSQALILLHKFICLLYCCVLIISY